VFQPPTGTVSHTCWGDGCSCSQVGCRRLLNRNANKPHPRLGIDRATARATAPRIRAELRPCVRMASVRGKPPPPREAARYRGPPYARDAVPSLPSLPHTPCVAGGYGKPPPPYYFFLTIPTPTEHLLKIDFLPP